MDREKEIEKVELAAEEMLQTVIRKSLDVLDDMEKDVMKLRKNACQKDVKEKFLLYCRKMDY